MKTLKILSTDRVEIKYFMIKKKKNQTLNRCKKKKKCPETTFIPK